MYVFYSRPTLVLPEYLTPENILRTHVTPLLSRSKTENIYDKNVESSSQSLALTLSDHLLASTLCQVESVSWVLNSLCLQIKATLQEMDLMVVEEFYLPAPPLFSLQRFEEVCKTHKVRENAKKTLSCQIFKIECIENI